MITLEQKALIGQNTIVGGDEVGESEEMSRYSEVFKIVSMSDDSSIIKVTLYVCAYFNLCYDLNIFMGKRPMIPILSLCRAAEG